MRCIFHDDRHPSMIVFPDTYKCYSCGAFGKTQHLLNQLTSHVIPRRQAEVAVKNPFYTLLRRDSLPLTLKRAYKALQGHPALQMYMRERGFTPETIQKTHIGYTDGFFLIPIVDDAQRPVGALARSDGTLPNSRYFVPHGQESSLLYSPDWQRVYDADSFYLTFGTLDAISIDQCGKPAVSTTSGKRVRPEWFSDFRKKIKIFSDFGEEKEALKLTAGLGWRGSVVKYHYPYGLKDPNDLLKTGILQGIL